MAAKPPSSIFYFQALRKIGGKLFLPCPLTRSCIDLSIFHLWCPWPRSPKRTKRFPEASLCSLGSVRSQRNSRLNSTTAFSCQREYIVASLFWKEKDRLLPMAVLPLVCCVSLKVVHSKHPYQNGYFYSFLHFAKNTPLFHVFKSVREQIIQFSHFSSFEIAHF